MKCIGLLWIKNSWCGDCRCYIDIGDSESRGVVRGVFIGIIFVVCVIIVFKNDWRNGWESIDGFVCSGSWIGMFIWLYGLKILCFKYKNVMVYYEMLFFIFLINF